MGFPWEIDEQPEAKKIHAKRGYKKRIRGNANKRRKNYQVSGHPVWYPQYLKTEHWLKFKERWKRWSIRKCCIVCGDHRYELHHWTYERIGHEDLRDVVPLCRMHHARAHMLEKDGTPLAEAHLKLR